MKRFFRNYYPQLFKFIIMSLVMVVICSWMLCIMGDFEKIWILQSAVISTILLIATTLIYNYLNK